MPSSLTRVLSRAWASSARLPVSVCGTVTGRLARGFSGPTGGPVRSDRSPASSPRSGWRSGFAYPAPYQGERTLPMVRWPRRRRPPAASLAAASGAGMSTGYPSPTPFGLGLGPAEPRRTNLAWETSGFRRERFSLSFSLLIPAVSLPSSPALLAVDLLPGRNAPLPSEKLDERN